MNSIFSPFYLSQGLPSFKNFLLEIEAFKLASHFSGFGEFIRKLSIKMPCSDLPETKFLEDLYKKVENKR